MSWLAHLVGGFVGTVLLTTLLVASQGLRLTRMNIPYMLGTMITPDRDRAKLYGALLHLLNGWLFALVYWAIFAAWGRADPLAGAVIGLGHALFVLVVVLPTLPSVHPRMAGETHGPSPTRQLEPPGFMALHYGVRTPISVVFAHLVYGAVLGYAFGRVG